MAVDSQHAFHKFIFANVRLTQNFIYVEIETGICSSYSSVAAGCMRTSNSSLTNYNLAEFIFRLLESYPLTGLRFVGEPAVSGFVICEYIVVAVFPNLSGWTLCNA